jgi:hypothetical protein
MVVLEGNFPRVADKLGFGECLSRDGATVFRFLNADDPRAERRRRLAEPDLEYAEFCDRTKTPWRSTVHGELARTAYQAERRRRGKTDEDPFEAYDPFRQVR